jgi:23S rRNA (pseudouridine1915-N3)-methyltransferase
MVSAAAVAVIAVGERMPAWVDAALADYLERLPREWRTTLVTVRAVRRGAGRPAADALAAESQRLLAAVPRGALLVALDERGTQLATRQFAARLARWREQHGVIAFVIGGADGLHDEVRQRAAFLLSLSAMTLPHALARVLLVEQLYRAVSLLAGHPYHRD